MKSIFIAIVLFAGIIPAAKADFIIDTGQPFESGLSPDHGGYPSIPGTSQYYFNEFFGLATKFTINETVRISSLEGFLISDEIYPGRPTNYDIVIYGDGNDVIDDNSVFYSGNRENQLVQSHGFQWDGLKSLDLTLEKGSYWLAFESAGFSGAMAGLPSYETDGVWFDTYSSFPDKTWHYGENIKISFRIGGTAVPEPVSSALMLIGGGVMVLRRRFNILDNKPDTI